MSHRLDDKSALAEYCTPEGEHSPSESSCHTNLLAPTVELPQHSFPLLTEATSTVARDKVPRNPPHAAGVVEPHIQRDLRRIPPRRLALCGGGMRCIAHIGVFKALEQYGLLSSVKEVIGLSGGALFALMFCLGYKVSDIEKLALELDFQNLATIEPEMLLDFPQTLGCNSGQALQSLVASILRQKGIPPEATFQDVAASGKFTVAFRCYATELQTARSLEFSVTKTPTLPLTLALRATAALPFLYCPVADPKAPHILWADGGVLHNVPFAFLSDYEKTQTWAVQFLADRANSVPEPIHDPLDYFQYIYTAAFEMKNRWLYERYSSQILQISIPTQTALHFNLTREQRQELMTHAEQKTVAFLQTHGHPLPKRRYSAA